MNFEGTYMDMCQSCSMPLKKPEDYGTNEDESPNYEYCFKCFEKGKFLQPEITMEEMVEGCARIMEQFGVPKDEAREKVEKIIPTLKRWKKNNF